MDYTQAVSAAKFDAKNLEMLYQHAAKQGELADFTAAIQSGYREAPDNLLYAAWYYRLQETPAEPVRHPGRTAIWLVALPLALLSAVLIGILFTITPTFRNIIPYFILLWSPVAAAVAIAFLAVAARGNYRTAILSIGLLVVAALYVFLISLRLNNYSVDAYTMQMAIHLPLLAWIAIGLALLGLRSLIPDRFAFLIKSIEVAITAGLYLIAGVAFGAITVGLLQALSIQLPQKAMEFFTGAGIGLIAIIAIASVYDPRLRPGEQDFTQGLSKFIANMMRLLLPLTLVVLAIYILLIPFNFMQPFTNRDVLIIYNIMLFAIMGLLIGATPILTGDLSPRLSATLRAGILVIAGLAVLISLYALAAILYRTFNNVLTMNRLVIIGWNLINITILCFLFVQVWKKGKDGWAHAAQMVFSRAMLAYVVWDLFVIFAIPLIFK